MEISGGSPFKSLKSQAGIRKEQRSSRSLQDKKLPREPTAAEQQRGNSNQIFANLLRTHNFAADAQSPEDRKPAKSFRGWSISVK